MILIKSKKLVGLLTLGKAQAITLYPFVIVNRPQIGERIINHEKIHLRQQLELLILPFYLIYLIEFFVHFMACKEFDLAYRSISFEREAYANDTNFQYIKTRKLFQGFRYFNLKVQG